VNSITLVGNLTKDPLSRGEEADPVCRLRLAEAKAHPDHPLYVNVSVFGPQALVCAERLRKGARVAVVGRLRFREWKRVDLSRRSEHWIAADRVDFLDAAPTPEAEEAPAELAPTESA
jgi:single stranded DNA-binding protein